METEPIKDVLETNDESCDEETVSTPQQPSTWKPQDADREVIKANIRRRVWTSNASPKAQFIPAKPLPTGSRCWSENSRRLCSCQHKKHRAGVLY